MNDQFLNETDIAKLRKNWCDALNVASVTDADDFFLVGGDSLSLVELQMKIEDSFGIVIDFRELAEMKTFADLARILSEGMRKK